jgi:hypothetical protein
MRQQQCNRNPADGAFPGDDDSDAGDVQVDGTVTEPTLDANDMGASSDEDDEEAYECPILR